MSCGGCQHFIKFKNDKFSSGLCRHFDRRTNTDNGHSCDAHKRIPYVRERVINEQNREA